MRMRVHSLHALIRFCIFVGQQANYAISALCAHQRQKEEEEAAIQVLVLHIYLYDVLAHEA